MYTYRVIATDYTTYAIHRSCYSLLNVHFGKFSDFIRFIRFKSNINELCIITATLWVLSRDPTYPDSVRRVVRQQLNSLRISTDLLSQSPQNCDNIPPPISLG